VSAQSIIDGVFEDRASGRVRVQQRFDVGLQRAIAAAQFVKECLTILGATHDCCIEDRLDALPPIALAHADSCGRPLVIRR
jgi:hypothetical protein